ncbi:MAG: hypothetical protein L0Y50_07235 [Beijerinckiaceae bacterium]|nr:hypothetical protein [Beijerinckiaceae bacterium]MCI0736050.1 hypothetical protein [Beijerinckiaceae bacterium]
MLASFRIPIQQAFIPFLVLAIFPLALSTSARPEVHVTGGVNSMKIEADRASVEELLTALNMAFGLQYRSSADLGRTVSGTFEGPLSNVLSRVLRGYNYSADISTDGTRVAVYDLKPGHGSLAAAVSKSAAAPSAESQRQDVPKRVKRDLGREDSAPLPAKRMKQAHSQRGIVRGVKTKR